MTAPSKKQTPPSLRPEQPHLLVVDDQPLDIELTLIALAEACPHLTIRGVGSGEEALDYLRCQGPHVGRPPVLPALILLDLNMLGLSGADVLAAVRGDPALARVRVMMLTTSDLPGDRARCRAADAYCVKPLKLDLLAQCLEQRVTPLLDERPADVPPAPYGEPDPRV